MKTALVAGLSEKEADEIRADFSSNAVFRQRVIDILQKKINASVESTRVKDAYNNPNWAFLQADAVGYQRALAEIISILE